MKKILIVDDEAGVQEALKTVLKQDYEIICAMDGVQAIEMFQEHNPHLVLLDIAMPTLGGLEVLRKIREGNTTSQVIMLTANNMVKTAVEAMKIGSTDYLTKPFAFEELLARIRALLRRPPVAVEDELMCSDLNLNTQSYFVSRNGKEISLTRKEFALLEYLMRNKGKILTKEQIITHVWDYDSDILENTVEKYIGYLRTKIDSPFPKSKKLIQTVRGFGYKIFV